jgi:hypothetical protein
VKTVTELAHVLEVNRRQISKWRSPKHETTLAPQSLDLKEWAKWLRRTARSKWAQRAENWVAEVEAGGQQQDLAMDEVAGDAAPAVQVASQGPQALPWQPLEVDASDAQREARAKAQRAEAAAMRERLELEQRLGDVVPLSAMRLFTERLQGLLNEELKAGIWNELVMHLDGIDGRLRRKLHGTHDAALLDLRRRLAIAIKDRLHDAVTAGLR